MNKRFYFILSFFLLTIVAAPQPGNPSTVPLVGGLSLLIAAGAVFGVKKLYDSKKAQQDL